jgi:hypothetical protein
VPVNDTNDFALYKQDLIRDIFIFKGKFITVDPDSTNRKKAYEIEDTQEFSTIALHVKAQVECTGITTAPRQG